MKFASASMVAMGFALALAGASGAMAQSDQHDDQHDQKAPPAQHMTAPHPMDHSTTHGQMMPQHPQMHVSHPTNHTVVARGNARWSNGGHYTGGRVVFSDWNRYHLRQPPYGYEWVQDDDELVLISIGTGIITDVFLIPG